MSNSKIVGTPLSSSQVFCCASKMAAQRLSVPAMRVRKDKKNTFNRKGMTTHARYEHLNSRPIILQTDTGIGDASHLVKPWFPAFRVSRSSG
jgi:hypothetical protein